MEEENKTQNKNNKNKNKYLTASELDRMAKQVKQEEAKLLKTYKSVKTDVETNANPYMKNVVQSYKKYFEKKGADKQMRYEMLTEIHRYLEELKERDDLLEGDIKHIKQDMKQVLGEMRNIKAELKKLHI